MIKLNFIFSKTYLAFLCVNKERYLPLYFQRELIKILKEEKDNPYFYFIFIKNNRNIEWAVRSIYIQEEKTKEISEGITRCFRKIFNLKGFKKMCEESLIFKQEVSKQWEKNKKLVEDYLKKIIKKQILINSFKVITSHPCLNEGHADRPNLIYWSHKAEFDNYHTVYLTHEMLHLIFDYFKIPTNNLTHALIELISDNELRIRLNKKGEYFYEGSVPTHHPELLSLEKKILPYWKNYLEDKTAFKNIISFYKFLQKNFNYS